MPFKSLFNSSLFVWSTRFHFSHIGIHAGGQLRFHFAHIGIHAGGQLRFHFAHIGIHWHSFAHFGILLAVNSVVFISPILAFMLAVNFHLVKEESGTGPPSLLLLAFNPTSDTNCCVFGGSK
ncbi:hypothetical protein TNCV_4514261 [Trichonephila clavipes]|nr:hypothetical protein TNCV_4514261 [Trichonephila clavipes]